MASPRWKNNTSHAPPQRRSAPPRAPAATRSMRQGKVSYVNLEGGYGWLTPLEEQQQLQAADHGPHPINPSPSTLKLQELDRPDQACHDVPLPLPPDRRSPSYNHNVYFRLPPAATAADDVVANAHQTGAPPSTTHTGLLMLKPGDVLEFIYRSGCHAGADKPRAAFARLVSASHRSSTEMASYLTLLLCVCLQHSRHDIVLRALTMAPHPLLLVLNYPSPEMKMTLLILKLATAVVQWEKASSLYSSKIKEFFRFFSRTQFPRTLCEIVEKAKEEMHCQQAPNVPSWWFRGEKATKKLEQEWEKPLQTLLESAELVLLRLLRELPDNLCSYLSLIGSLDMKEPIRTEQSGSKKLPSFAMQVINTIARSSAAKQDDPNESWDKLSLLPLNCEIKTALDGLARPITLPVAKLQESYESAEQYIDTYFRLLREDSFAGLKKGLSDFRNGRLDARDMTVWTQVTIVGVHFSSSSPGMVLGLALKQGKVNNQRAKPPLDGSLLCICDSGGTFENPIWAISSRSEKTKKRGSTALFVEILEQGTTDSASISCWARVLQAPTMVVAVSPAYYRAYEPVLRGLQQLDPKTLPFREELVHGKSPGMAPSYLNDNTCLDWSCFPHDTTKVFGKLIGGVTELILPTLEGFQTTLDASQVKAVNHILSNRLAIMQGPPGTGKSFVSVRIIQLLLSASTKDQKPILIMTYKNQALDHMLESCMPFCNKPGELVRVGGNSKSEKLMDCNLQTLLKKVDTMFASERASNREKLSEIETNLRKALHDLYKSRSFDVEALITQPSSSEFIQKLLLRQETQNWSPSTDTSDEQHKHVSKVLKQWMPRKHVFTSIQDHLSLLRPVNKQFYNLSQHSDLGSSFEHKDDNSEDSSHSDDEREESEDLWQDIKSGNTGPKTCDWLTKDFMSFEELDQGMDLLLQGFTLNNFDAAGYSWLLEADPWQLAEEHRCILILLVMQQNLEATTKSLLESKEEYDQVCLDNAEMNKRKRVEVLQNAKVIGMTTTGAAMNQDILAAIQPSIILVEEAAEILEPQLMAILSPSVRHLILVGDHKQLRPSVNSYNLETRHNLAVSMLERLAEYKKLPFQALGYQSRMRPEFLQMVKPMYPHLRTNIAAVSGTRNNASMCMKSTMYFWSHSFEEATDRSPSNEGEAYMVMALVKWLLSQGHTHKDITVICAYGEQVAKLRKMMQEVKEEGKDNVDVQTIDRFQGSENQIIIASLVRSNSEKKIGHLSEKNRLCVTVSRARSGIYLCGDADTLQYRSADWRNLLNNCFRSSNCLGQTILLTCPRHPKDPPFPLNCNQAKTFSPDLCKRPCAIQLPCGHRCTATCHTGNHAVCRVEIEHTFQDCKHSITILCSQDTSNLKCQTEMWIELQNCGHYKKCSCWEIHQNVPSLRECKFPCGKTRTCGHPCKLLCHQACESQACSKCTEIKRIQEAKQRELKRKEIEDKFKNIDSEIAKLKAQTHKGPLFIDLYPEGETAAEYRMVQDRTEKYIQLAHENLPVVTKVQRVTNPELQTRFLEAQRELVDAVAPPQLLFHGTDDAGVEGITATGFRLPAPDRQNMFGRGCYFATDSSKSAQDLYTKGSKKLLLCEVLLGRPWSLHAAQPDLDLKRVRSKGYDSVFSVRGSRGSGGTEYDEYIIYNPNQAIPRYIVHYESLGSHTRLEFIQNIRSSGAFGRVCLNASQTGYGGQTADEYHFRFAEAQFLRMSSVQAPQKVTKVEYTWNRDLEEKFEKKKRQFQSESKPTSESLVFHGTKRDSIDKIIREGFKVGGTEGVPIRVGAVYGTGIYTAANPEISIPYSDSSAMMLLSVALCGRKGDDYTHGAAEDVFVVKHPHQLLPRYIVHFSSRKP